MILPVYFLRIKAKNILAPDFPKNPREQCGQIEAVSYFGLERLSTAGMAELAHDGTVQLVCLAKTKTPDRHLTVDVGVTELPPVVSTKCY